MHQMWTIAIDDFGVCLSVCLSITRLRCANTAERREDLFEMETGDPRNIKRESQFSPRIDAAFTKNYFLYFFANFTNQFVYLFLVEINAKWTVWKVYSVRRWISGQLLRGAVAVTEKNQKKRKGKDRMDGWIYGLEMSRVSILQISMAKLTPRSLFSLSPRARDAAAGV